MLLLGFMFDRVVPGDAALIPPPAPPAEQHSRIFPPAAAPAAAPPPKTKKGKGGSGTPAQPPTEETEAAAAADAKEPEPFATLAASDGALRWVVAAVLIQAMATSFAFLAPLVYGSPMTKAMLDSRMWVEGWR